MRHSWLIATAVFCLSACSTPYQEMGLLGGVSAQHIDAQTVIIAARGNGFTDATRIRTYTLRKAAEVAVAEGYDWFSVEGSEDRTRHSSYQTEGSYNSTTTANVYGSGDMAFGTAQTSGTYMPGQTVHYIKPGTDLIVRLHRGPKPEDASGFVAAEVLAYMTPKK